MARVPPTVRCRKPTASGMVKQGRTSDGCHNGCQGPTQHSTTPQRPPTPISHTRFDAETPIAPPPFRACPRARVAKGYVPQRSRHGRCPQCSEVKCVQCELRASPRSPSPVPCPPHLIHQSSTVKRRRGAAKTFIGSVKNASHHRPKASAFRVLSPPLVAFNYPPLSSPWPLPDKSTFSTLYQVTSSRISYSVYFHFSPHHFT